jgi:hypothetical protein
MAGADRAAGPPLPPFSFGSPNTGSNDAKTNGTPNINVAMRMPRPVIEKTPNQSSNSTRQDWIRSVMEGQLRETSDDFSSQAVLARTP